MSVSATKVTLSLIRTLFIISLFGLDPASLHAFQQSSIAKTKYEFTDIRVSEADTLLKKRKYEEALVAYQAAYDTYEKEEFYEGMVYARERMGKANWFLGKDSLSNANFQLAVQLSKKHNGNLHILESKALLNNGIRAHYKRKFELGASYLDSAAWAYHSSHNADTTILRSIFEFKFYTYYYSNLNSDTLVKYLDEKAKLYEVIETSLEEEVFLLSDYNRAYFKIGDFLKASAYGLEAVRRSEEFIDSIQAFYYTDALFNLGRTLHRQDDLEQALGIANKLIDYALINNPNDRELPAYRNLKAVILNGLENYEEAAKEFAGIIEILEYKSIKNEFYRNAIANLGVCYQKMELYEKSEGQLLKALKLEKESSNSSSASYIERYKYLGQLYQAMGVYEKSVYYYDSALRNAIPDNTVGVLDYPLEARMDATYEILSILRSKQIGMEKLYGREIFKDSIQLLKAAIDYSQRTHQHLMNNRKVLQASAGKLYLSRDFKDMYESALNAVYELKQTQGTNRDILETAFDFIAKSKANLFLEQSGELGKIQGGLVPKTLADRYYRLKTEITSLEKKFYRLFDEITNNDSIRYINSRLMVLNAELAEVMALIDKETMVMDSNKDDSYERINARLRKDPLEGYLEYFVGEDYIFSLFLSKEKTEFRRFKINEVFQNSFKGILNKLATRPNTKNYDSDLNEFQNHASQLYEFLLGEFFESENYVKRLMIVPDEQLSKLPFEVLVESKNSNAKYFFELNYLLKKCTISYALSSNEVFKKAKAKTAKKGILGIGYSGSLATETRSGNLGALPGTEEEINFLSSALKGDFLMGDEGSKSEFLNNASNYDILHLAVHGEANDISRYESSLIFNGATDNILETSDLFVANLAARLAVLSACESGVGQINRGEGTFSIARGFALVGVPSIIMSLWRVNDEIASGLMVDFHMNMLEGESVSDALSQSKLNFLLNESGQYTSHPYYWSAFVSLGDDISLHNTKGTKYYKWVYLGLLLVLTACMLTIMKKRKGA